MLRDPASVCHVSTFSPPDHVSNIKPDDDQVVDLLPASSRQMLQLSSRSHPDVGHDATSGLCASSGDGPDASKHCTSWTELVNAGPDGHSTATRPRAPNESALENSGSSLSPTLKTGPATLNTQATPPTSIHQQHVSSSILSSDSFLPFIPVPSDILRFVHDELQMSNPNPEPGAPNALSVLFDALPSQIVSAIQSDVPFTALPTAAVTASSASGQASLSTPASTLQPNTSASPTLSSTSALTSSTSSASASTTSTSSSSSSPSSTSTSSSTTTTTSTTLTTSSSSTTSSSTSTQSTLSTSFLPSTTSSAAAESTTTLAPPTTRHELSDGAVAGIATGVVAAAVLILFGVVFFVRRRQRGKPFFGGASKRSIGSGRAYPEVAWLYDPSPTPPHTPPEHTRDESERALLPNTRGGRQPEMTAAAGPSSGIAASGSPELPEFRQADFESPLLPAQMPAVLGNSNYTHHVSPAGSPNGSPRSSDGSWRSARSWTPSPPHGR